MADRVGAAAENFLHAGGDEPLEAQLRQVKAGGLAAAGLQIARFQVADQIPQSLIHRAHGAVRQRLLQKADRLVIEPRRVVDADGEMHGEIDSRCEAVAQAFAAIGMAGNLQAPAMGLIHDGLVLLERQRGNIDHRAIRLERAASARVSG